MHVGAIIRWLGDWKFCNTTFREGWNNSNTVSLFPKIHNDFSDVQSWPQGTSKVFSKNGKSEINYALFLRSAVKYYTYYSYPHFSETDPNPHRFLKKNVGFRGSRLFLNPLPHRGFIVFGFVRLFLLSSFFLPTLHNEFVIDWSEIFSEASFGDPNESKPWTAWSEPIFLLSFRLRAGVLTTHVSRVCTSCLYYLITYNNGKNFQQPRCWASSFTVFKLLCFDIDFLY